MITLIRKLLKDEAGVSDEVRKEILDYLAHEIYDSQNPDIQYPIGYNTELCNLELLIIGSMYWNPVKKRWFFAK